MIVACSKPLYRYIRHNGLSYYARVPCGWCMSCRIDKRNYYRDMFEYSFNKVFGGVGAFVCLTYDDNHIPMSPDGLVPTLRKKDTINFIKRLRSYIRYHKLDSPFISKRFRFFCAGEYGSDLHRPHYHFLFTGLDFSVLSNLLQKCWHNGVIQTCGPILRGGINYTMKYMDKQLFGDELDLYYDQGIEPPFFHCSHSVAPDLFKYNINLKNGTYKWRGKDRPLPSYVKNRLLIASDFSERDYIKDFALKNNMSYDDADLYLRRSKELALERTCIRSNLPVRQVSDFPDTCHFFEVPRRFK